MSTENSNLEARRKYLIEQLSKGASTELLEELFDVLLGIHGSKLDKVGAVAAYLWRLKIADRARNTSHPASVVNDISRLGSFLERAKRSATYRQSTARLEFEKLCFNGCGELRKGKSEYCGDACRKKLTKWINEQSQLTDIDLIRKHTASKKKRFSDSLRKKRSEQTNAYQT